jgi:hypothetical protein
LTVFDALYKNKNKNKNKRKHGLVSRAIMQRSM